MLGDCCWSEPVAEAMASPTPLAGVHWIRVTIPTIYDDLHQAFVVAEGAATGTGATAGSAGRCLGGVAHWRRSAAGEEEEWRGRGGA